MTSKELLKNSKLQRILLSLLLHLILSVVLWVALLSFRAGIEILSLIVELEVSLIPTTLRD